MNRFEEIEREYMTPQEEEVGGFWRNVSDFYGMKNWGDWWRGLFKRETPSVGGGKEGEGYTVYPEWGEANIRTLRDIMREE